MIDATWNLAHVDDESDLTELSTDEEDLDSVPIATLSEHEQAVGSPCTNSTVSSTFAKIPRKTTRLSTQEATQKSKARTKDKWPVPAVESHTTISFSASTLYNLINKGMIELNPEYQRGIVWSETKQSNFINSLYHRFHAPEIVFNVTYGPDGTKLRTCMDGKQRLTSICNFFDGKIPLMPYLNAADAPGYSRRKFWTKKNGNVTRPLIPPNIMDNLETSSIACVEYLKLTPNLEREIFQRVQHGVPLTPSDRLPAINGPWAEVVRDLRNRMNTTEGFEGYLDWGKARGKDFQALAQIVYLAINGTSPKKAHPSSQRIETFLSSNDGKPDSAKHPIINTMDIFCRIARTPNIDDPLTKNLSPLEFVMAGFLIFQHRTSLTDRQLSEAICRMREHAKRRTNDLKFDQANFKVFLDFVLRNLPKLVNQLVKPEENEKPAALTPYRRRESVVDRFKYNVNLDTAMDSAVVAGGKRKRSIEDDDLDGEDDDAIWIVEAPAMKPRAKKASQSLATKVDLSKVANRESKARTTLKKSPQKNITGSAIKPHPAPKLASSKVDGQVGRPSIRPTPSMAVQKPSTLPQSRSAAALSTVVDSIPAFRTGKYSVPSRQVDAQFFKARVSSIGSRTISQAQARVDIANSPKVFGGVIPSSTIVARNPANAGISPSHPISPATTYLNRHDNHGNMAQRTHLSAGARSVNEHNRPC